MKLKNVSFGQLAMEFISVVFAVLLALGLNSYKQSIDMENDAKRLKASILAECAENQIKVDSMLIKNESFRLYLDSLVHLDSDSVRGVSFNYNFELLTNAAWDIAQNNAAINNLDKKFLLDAAGIYNAQKLFSEFALGFFLNIGEYIRLQEEVTPYNTAHSFYYSTEVLNSSLRNLSRTENNL